MKCSMLIYSRASYPFCLFHIDLIFIYIAGSMIQTKRSLASRPTKKKEAGRKGRGRMVGSGAQRSITQRYDTYKMLF